MVMINSSIPTNNIGLKTMYTFIRNKLISNQNLIFQEIRGDEKFEKYQIVFRKYINLNMCF